MLEIVEVVILEVMGWGVVEVVGWWRQAVGLWGTGVKRNGRLCCRR